MSSTDLTNIGTNQTFNAFRPVVALSALIVLSVALVTALSTRSIVEKQVRQDASNLLTLHQQSIDNTIEHLRHLPITAARDSDLIALLEAATSYELEAPPELVSVTNAYLQSVAESANASIFFVIDVFGNTVASSNWNTPLSLVGKNYSYRPYFQDAIKGEEARYFAIGSVTNEAGYYFAHPVVGRHGVIGIVVVKSELESVQSQWAKSGDSLILFDEYGVSVLASDSAWRFKTLNEVPYSDLARLRDQYKYAGRQLNPLWDSESSSAAKIRLSGKNYMISKTELTRQDWQLWHLSPTNTIATATILAILGSLLLSGLSAALILYRREKIRKDRLSLAAQEANNMRHLNQQLEAEISERKRAETELRAAQAELIQASKLAALGQMSAAVAHEVNQPLAAMRTFGASAKLLLDRDEKEAVKKNLDEINSLTERMATITTDLKLFATKSTDAANRVRIQRCINNVLNLVQPTLLRDSVEVTQELPEHPVYVLGTAIRIELVITNLLTNAIHATKTREKDRRIKLHLFVDNDEISLRVSDNGHGVDSDTIDNLFDPFFTTKPAGEGVGLGLAISYAIVREMDGAIRVRNNEDGGALFSLRLKKAPAENNNALNPSQPLELT